MDPIKERNLFLTRRRFFGRTALGLGSAALASLLNPSLFAAMTQHHGDLGKPMFAPKAKRIIYLFMSGGPSQLDLLDYKPNLQKLHKTELPHSVRGTQRLTGMTSGQASFPIAASAFKFKQHGQCGAWISELLPHTASIADDIAVLKTVNTEAINHDPATTFIQTGSQQPGRPSFGAWLNYGLGSMNSDLPAFVVMISRGSSSRDAQPLFARLWGAGFLPSQYQGVNFRAGTDPVLYLSNPEGFDHSMRKRFVEGLSKLNQCEFEAVGDPEIEARITQYEMAFRMQTSVPDLADISKEPDHILDMYGPDVRRPGSFAANCLLARRLAERNVRFIQLYHRGWDQHGDLPHDLALQAKDVDQASAALVKDLKARGLLDDTLVVWGGEFGRTTYSQGQITATSYGRDHHGRCFSVWIAGGGIKPGISYGQTDDFSYNIVENPVHIHDMNATLLDCLGINHEKLTFHYQGRDFRLTDVHGNVVRDVLA
jgi:hypothetical protein